MLNGQYEKSTTERISLLFIGDIMGHDEQLWSAQDLKTNTWNFDSVFRFIKPLIEDSDITIGNLEVTLGGSPYKGYPRFSSPAAFAQACSNAGIDVLMTANNHSADLGKAGISGTIKRLDSLNIKHTGSFLNQASRDSLSPLILKKGNISLALLNYTFSTNGIKVPPPLIVNPIDKTQITSDIEKAKKLLPDKIIVFIHWGNEYDTIPSKEQTELSEFLFSQGADIVIGSHPHVIQKVIMFNKEDGKSKIIAYSLGNFVSNQSKPLTEGGLMVKVELTLENNSVDISDAGYYLTWVYKPIIHYKKKFYILPCSEYEYAPDFFLNQTYYSKMKKFLNISREFLRRQNTDIHEITFAKSASILNN